ncbi:hypothetical protein GF389_04625 [Candidatus Dojkabacteria bacterium]|nr:hypothetical protein [Candidatus Dojkabacteria bacterium]
MTNSMNQTDKLYNKLVNCKENTIFPVKKHGKVNNPVVIYDADGTILDLVEGTHWMAAINLLDDEAKSRIKNRIKVLENSSDLFSQQYLSASSIQELLATGIDLDYAAKKVRLREGIDDLMRNLAGQNISQIILSHGFTDILEKVLKVNGIDFIKVYSNVFPEGVKLDKSFIPPYETLEEMKNSGDYFQEIVKGMKVVPNTKGDVLQSLGYEQTTIISLGDSIGDIDMFKDTQALGGISILHTHYDKGEFSLTKDHFKLLIPHLSYISVNSTDQSFKPSGKLVLDLLT